MKEGINVSEFSLRELKQFRNNSVVWKQMTKVGKEWIEKINREMAVAPKESIYNTHYDEEGRRQIDIIYGVEHWQGAAAELLSFLELPDMLIHELEGMIEEKEASNG